MEFATQQQDSIKLLIKVACNEGRWEEFLDQFVEHCNLKTANLVIFDRNTFLPIFHRVGGDTLSEEAVLSYAAHYALQDPVIANLNHTEVGKVKFVHDLVETKSFLNSSYYRNWCVKYDIRDGGSIKLFSDDDRFGELIFNRRHDQPLFTDQHNAEYMEFLAPYICQTLRSTCIRSQQPSNKEALQASVNAYRFPAALYSNNADLIAANESWADIKKNLIEKDKSRHTLFDQNLFKAVGYLNKNNYGVKYCSWLVEDLDLMLQFSNVSMDEHQTQTILIFAFSLQSVKLPDPEHIEAIFEFTSKESMVCHKLLSGKPPKKIALELNISDYTVRDHIKSIYRKTRCNSQINLVRLLYSIPG